MTETKSQVQKHVEACDGVLEMHDDGSNTFTIEVDGSRTVGVLGDVLDTLPVLWMVNQVTEQEDGTVHLLCSKYTQIS